MPSEPVIDLFSPRSWTRNFSSAGCIAFFSRYHGSRCRCKQPFDHTHALNRINHEPQGEWPQLVMAINLPSRWRPIRRLKGLRQPK
jgi:hypothetical protein